MCGFYVSGLLDHDRIKYMIVFFPHYLGFFLNNLGIFGAITQLPK